MAAYINCMRFSRICLWLEFIALAIGVPVLFFFTISRPLMTTSMWVGSLIALFWLQRRPGFSWKRFWQGTDSAAARKADRANHILGIQLLLGAVLATALVHYLDPSKMFFLPLERPGWWVIVMVLYPILSVLPQEVIYRAYFFERYQPLFPNPKALLWASAASFGFLHILFHNWVAPLLSFLGGYFFASSYTRDRSLKWVAIEHALYGCMIFTVGLGWYFFLGAQRPLG